MVSYRWIAAFAVVPLACYAAVPTGFGAAGGPIVGGQAGGVVTEQRCDATNLTTWRCRRGFQAGDGVACPRSQTYHVCNQSASSTTSFKLCGREDGDEVCLDDADACTAEYEDIILDKACTEVIYTGD